MLPLACCCHSGICCSTALIIDINAPSSATSQLLDVLFHTSQLDEQWSRLLTHKNMLVDRAMKASTSLSDVPSNCRALTRRVRHGASIESCETRPYTATVVNKNALQ